MNILQANTLTSNKPNNMKTLVKLMAVVGLMAIPAAHAEEGHAHEHGAKKAGPNGGRVISSVDPHVEFFVMPDRKLKLTFLDADGKAIAAKGQSVTGIGGERSKPTKFTFVKEGDVLISDAALPEGNLVPLILQVKVTPDAKTVIEKFTVNMSDCPGCEYLEYACTCDH
jgi:hypothetical protein